MSLRIKTFGLLTDKIHKLNIKFYLIRENNWIGFSRINMLSVLSCVNLIKVPVSLFVTECWLISEITNKCSGINAYIHIYHSCFQSLCSNSIVNLDVLHETSIWCIIWRSRIKLSCPFYLSLLGLVISSPWILCSSFVNWDDKNNIGSAHSQRWVVIKWDHVCDSLYIWKYLTKSWVVY